jgi:hypothetical protein
MDDRRMMMGEERMMGFGQELRVGGGGMCTCLALFVSAEELANAQGGPLQLFI